MTQPQGRTTAESLLIGLRAQGFSLRIEEGKLIVAPLSKLTPLQLESLKAAKKEIIAVLAWEELSLLPPPATDATLRAWYRALEKDV